MAYPTRAGLAFAAAALYTHIDKLDADDCRFGAGGPGTAGQDCDGFSLGLRHGF